MPIGQAPSSSSRSVMYERQMIAQPSIPPNLSFYFSVEDLKPNYGRQTNRAFNNQYWKPPNVRDAYIRGPRTLYHYVGGRVFPVGETNPFENVDRQEYIFSTATIFSQEVCTPHLLAVNYDAETVNVRDHGADWPSLSFDHVPAQNTARVYSYVDNMRSQYKIAAPGSDKWIPQLLPPHYNYVPELNNSGQSIPCSNTSAGLIGSLPLLISLAAFSAPPNYLDTVLTRSIQPGAWHKHDYPIGRTPERGMVVTVYLCPDNPGGSTRERLKKLQNGDFGPFYR